MAWEEVKGNTWEPQKGEQLVGVYQGKEQGKHTITLTMPTSLHASVRSRARELGLSTSAYIRLAVVRACRSE